jgi:hypothetical protein
MACKYAGRAVPEVSMVATVVLLMTVDEDSIAMWANSLFTTGYLSTSEISLMLRSARFDPVNGGID